MARSLASKKNLISFLVGGAIMLVLQCFQEPDSSDVDLQEGYDTRYSRNNKEVPGALSDVLTKLKEEEETRGGKRNMFDNRSVTSTHKHHLDSGVRPSDGGDSAPRGNYLDGPVDPHEYKSIHNPKWRCLKKTGRRANMLLMFLVSSAPENFLQRKAIRETFGNQSAWNASAEIRTAFLLGATKNDTIQTWIHYEFNRHHDIIQERFVDSDLNSTIKTIMALKWFRTYCSHAQYMMKIDDHSVINQRNIYALLSDASTSDFIGAKLVAGQRVSRIEQSRKFLSEEFYPHPTFPPFMAGPIYVLSSALVKEVADVATRIPIFPLEDVFIGMCLRSIRVKIKDREHFLVRLDSSYDKRRREGAALTYTVISNVIRSEMTWMWELGRAES